jgi:hypothetical protein
MSNRNATRRRPAPEAEQHRSLLTIVLGVLLIGAAVAFFAARGGKSGKGGATPAAQAPASGPAGAAAGASSTPQGIVVPPPAIALPKDCPNDAAPQVDNMDRYGFCTPVGWGAYNNNNSLKITLIMKPMPNSGPPVLEPTDFDRIQILVALDTDPPQQEPAACKGPPNDSIDGLATHHCTATVDPNANPYHAVLAHYWTVDLANNQHFYMTALVGAGVTDEDNKTIDTIVHSVKPPSAG